MHIFCPALSIVTPCECRRRNLIWVCFIVLLCLLYEIYHRVDHHMHGYLNHFIAARITRALAALGDLALVNPRCRPNPFSRLFLPSAARLRNLLPSGEFSGGTLSSFKSAMNLCLRRAKLDFLFLLFYSLLSIMVLGLFWFIGASLFLVLCARQF